MDIKLTDERLRHIAEDIEDMDDMWGSVSGHEVKAMAKELVLHRIETKPCWPIHLEPKEWRNLFAGLIAARMLGRPTLSSNVPVLIVDLAEELVAELERRDNTSEDVAQDEIKRLKDALEIANHEIDGLREVARIHHRCRDKEERRDGEDE